MTYKDSISTLERLHGTPLAAPAPQQPGRFAAPASGGNRASGSRQPAARWAPTPEAGECEPPSVRSEVVRAVHRYGRTTFSFQALNRDVSHWSGDGGCVAYVDAGRARVAVSNPLSDIAREQDVMQAFAQDARRCGKRVRFFGVEGDVPEASAFEYLKVGEQGVWDPQGWPGGLRGKLRRQLSGARRKAVVSTRLVSSEELADPRGRLRRGLDSVIERWLASRRMAPMGFLVRIDPYHLADQRRFFVAEREGHVLGAMIAAPVCALGGWSIDTMVRCSSAPNGTIELLFDEAMRTFAADGSRHVTFGLCPLAGVSAPHYLAAIRRLGRGLYNFDGLHHFKAKLMPNAWQPIYLAYPRAELGALALFDAFTAFLPGGVGRFASHTLLRGVQTRPPHSADGAFLPASTV